MPKYLIDRMTISWNGSQEVKEAEQLRRMVGNRQLSQKLKELARDWMKRQHSSRSGS